MEAYYEIFSKCPLFAGISQKEMGEMLGCLNGKITGIAKGDPVFLEGDSARYMGVVLSGAIQVVRDDYYGNRSVLIVLSPGGLFGETFACAGLEALPVSAIALQNSTVLLLDCRRVLTGCTHACPFHSRLISNLLQVIAQKNLTLTQKIRYMSQKTTREKLMEFLLDQAKEQGNSEFVIPYDRQALADYLGVERSAMSAEIGKLRKEGLLESSGSHFRLRTSASDTKNRLFRFDDTSEKTACEVKYPSDVK
ncbi:MAG: Crp/Fnr family transcriptional regulator [Firmicutes bacterium]|nr:Crp/Fnr family transcriptional regulator [Bacillota bacterium]